MPETLEEITGQLNVAIEPGYRERLLDKGLARGLIWADGILPEGSPRFDPELTDNLLDYAFVILSLALRFKAAGGDSDVMRRAFAMAGEAIESAVHRGDNNLSDRGFNRLSASAAFHLAGYAARAYSVLPNNSRTENLTPTESAVFHLLRRRLDQMQGDVEAWLRDEAHTDANIAARLEREAGEEESENALGPDGALDFALTNSFMKGVALFNHALLTGAGQFAQQARDQFLLTANSASDVGAASHWWTATLAFHLVGDLWDFSLHSQLPQIPPDVPDGNAWNVLRWQYIHRLRLASKPALELWPSQLEAAKRCIDLADDLIVALPTSGGKTRIAELAILRALASGKRVIYVTPLRALSAQIERDLSSIFIPLGITVSTLYGGTGIESGDAETLKTGRIVVSTPEKLDFALKNDSTLIDDVGLIVLDEGHMLGPDEREVRYEALVQRLLRRPDSANRRLVCLSALFPSPADMADLVSWIRQDQNGDPVYSAWRPTRQRFGTLNAAGGHIRLHAKVENEESYLNNFIIPGPPPQESRRHVDFPNNRDELVLAAAWRFIEQKKDVMVYCALRDSVEKLGRTALKCVEHLVLTPLTEMNDDIRHAMKVGAEWLGEDHVAVRCLALGVALHHGGLPRAYLAEVEALLRKGRCRLTIASPTLAQGLNLSASVLLIPSIWRNQKIIPVAEFANVAGRAGRAFVDLDGLVLHVLWNGNRRALTNWNNLVARAKAPKVKSGILTLVAIILDRLALAHADTLQAALDYVTGLNPNWGYVASMSALPEDIEVGKVRLHALLGEHRPELVSAERWEGYLSSLDAALFALLEAGAPEANLPQDIDNVLQGSLFSRQMQNLEPALQVYLKSIVVSRAQFIWSQSNQSQRQGFHFAGIGLTAGQFLNLHLDDLEGYLLSAQVAIFDNNSNDLSEAVLQIARLVFTMAPFRPKEELPPNWEDALRAWISGEEAANVIQIGGDGGVDMLQDAFTYRLPWAMEAIRVVSKAAGTERSELFDGSAAMAVEVGSSHQPVIVLLRAGLASREASNKAVSDTNGNFDNLFRMRLWLESEEVQALSADPNWPTERTRTTWLQFVATEQEEGRKKWTFLEARMSVRWSTGYQPRPHSSVIMSPSDSGEGGSVLAPDITLVGRFSEPLPFSKRYIADTKITPDGKSVVMFYFGPPL